jgi:hypothetical protein
MSWLVGNTQGLSSSRKQWSLLATAASKEVGAIRALPLCVAATFDIDPVLAAPEPVRNLSWLGLVARTAFGGMEIAQLRVEVTAQRAPRRGVDGLRLIVQSYSPDALGPHRRPHQHARPIASLQRMVSPDELESGITVDLLQLDTLIDEVALIAWTESGDTQLDYDARAARPSEDCWYGESAAHPGVPSQVLLRAPGARRVEFSGG